MKDLGRWSLAVAVLAISSWVWLRIPPDQAPAATSKPSAEADRQPLGSSDDLISPVHRTNRVPTLVNEEVNKEDWVARFQAGGSNYFEFVRLAARAAYEGDGAAQYYIGRALIRCEETNGLYRDAGSA